MNDHHHAGVVVKPVGDFKTAGAYQYTTIRTNVDILKMIQLGLTFCNSKGELPSHNGELCVWQFNFREFDPENDMYAPESIKLLLDSGINFKANATRGVDQVKFAELLMTSGVVLNADVSWITFHSGYDFGFAPAAAAVFLTFLLSRLLEADRAVRVVALALLFFVSPHAACLVPHPLATGAARVHECSFTSLGLAEMAVCVCRRHGCDMGARRRTYWSQVSPPVDHEPPRQERC